MNILLDPLPDTVEIDGAQVPICSDFRTAIRFELLTQDGSLSDGQRISRALDLFYPQMPENIEAAVERALWFYSGGESGFSDGGEVSPAAAKRAGQVYSFACDGGYIFAAFLTQYGIDLQNIDYLHWWKFKALFAALKEDNEFVKIMGYRAMEITPNMSNEQKQFYRQMKKLYAIPLPQNEREKLTAIESALMRDGDLTGVL